MDLLKKLVGCSCAWSLAALAGSAIADDLSSKPGRATSIELKPLLLLEGNNHDLGGPGIDSNGARGLGVEVENPLTQHLAASYGLSASFYRISSGDQAEYRARLAARSEGTWAELQSASTLRVYLGGRYYDDVAQSSWYAGGRVGLGESRSFFEHAYDDELDLVQTTTEIEASIDSGFRWVLGSNVLIRSGISLTAREFLSRKIEGEDANPDTAREIKTAYRREQFPAFDLGMGYLF